MSTTKWFLVIPMSNTLSINTALSNAIIKINGSKRTFMPLWLTQLLLALFFTAIHRYELLSSHSKILLAFDLAYIVLNTLILIAYLYFGIQRARNQSISLDEIRNALQTSIILNKITLSIYWGLVLFIATLIAIMQPYSLILTGSIITFLIVRLTLAPSFIIDKKMNFVDAVEASYIATKNNFWKLVASYALLISVGLLLGGIGIFWLMPFHFIFMGEIYLQLGDGKSGNKSLIT